MELGYVPLGRTGLQVSELAFGTWRFGRKTDQDSIEIPEERAYELLDAYEEWGGRFIDTADIYGDGDSERWIGNWLAQRDRSEYVIASKVYWPTREDNPNFSGLSRTHVRRQVDAILDRLGTDYLDVLYIHRWDGATPAEQLMRTLNGVVEDGKVNFLGASTHVPDAWHIAKANEIAKRHGFEPFTVSQPRYNLVNREVEDTYLDMCADYGIELVPWSPLGQGVLTGKYSRDDMPEDSTASEDEGWEDYYLTEENFQVVDEVRAVAEEVDATPAQVSLAWLMHHQGIAAPIVGARTVDQLEENLGAATVELSSEQFERLAESKDSPLEGI
ncbi:aldo/keto reductase [Halapricum hydrolyticum]|uniref:Aldo/keto reductase n=1 Tax=Halapricum hydrolyticum TaxID=2979991 RepID=A0AAE3LIQ0_9EURY|nr:aldo/keto reductase [Halapricum hydrolyticum]MCU4719299.1 aldo/keto reductase [Halapricum hydrolyticum]MCU4728174.1 aldo/keto reductase [Halapricum hydrolyticum]